MHIPQQAGKNQLVLFIIGIFLDAVPLTSPSKLDGNFPPFLKIEILELEGFDLDMILV